LKRTLSRAPFEGISTEASFKPNFLSQLSSERTLHRYALEGSTTGC
jgi:hypothetical protein